MSKYNVHYDGSDNVTITLDGYENHETKNIPVVGSFNLAIDAETNQIDDNKLGTKSGDHPLIANAKRVLEKAGVENFGRLNYRDQASNAAVNKSYGLSTDALPVTEEGSDPDISSQAGGEGSVEDTDPATLKPNGVEKV